MCNNTAFEVHSAQQRRRAVLRCAPPRRETPPRNAVRRPHAIERDVQPERAASESRRKRRRQPASPELEEQVRQPPRKKLRTAPVTCFRTANRSSRAWHNARDLVLMSLYCQMSYYNGKAFALQEMMVEREALYGARKRNVAPTRSSVVPRRDQWSLKHRPAHDDSCRAAYMEWDSFVRDSLNRRMLQYRAKAAQVYAHITDAQRQGISDAGQLFSALTDSQ